MTAMTADATALAGGAARAVPGAPVGVVTFLAGGGQE